MPGVRAHHPGRSRSGRRCEGGSGIGPDCMNPAIGGRSVARRATSLCMVRTMPDQSSASTEHALIQEITGPLATLPDDPLPVVADVEFPTALRGYDRLAVDAYVRKTSQLVAELQATRSPDAAIRRALERVGEEVSGILQRAHETAALITSQSRSEAEDRLEAARQEAAQIVGCRRTAGPRARRRDRPDLGRASPDRRGHARAGPRAARADRHRREQLPGRGRARGGGDAAEGAGS